MAEKLIEFDLPKCTVFLYPSEVLKLLSHDTNLYAEGLRRGKRIKRSRQQKQREEDKSHVFSE